MNSIKEILGATLRNLVGSKKVVTAFGSLLLAALTAVAMSVAQHVGLQIDESTVTWAVSSILGLGGLTVVGQTFQDKNKEAARLDLLADRPELAESPIAQKGLFGFSDEMIINMGANLVLAQVKGPRNQGRIRAVALKLYRGIKSAYAGDPGFE